MRRGMSAALAAVAILGGCASLPRGAALESEIVSSAQQKEAGFAFYPVTRALMPVIAGWPELGEQAHSGWPAATPGAGGLIVAPGDVVAVTVWDSENNSLLAAPQQRAADLGKMTVSPAGRIFVPYVGEVRIAGMSPESARAAIQQQVIEIAPSAQVQLQMASGRSNTVDLVSGVARPGSYPLPDRNYSVLSVLSQGGGIPAGMRNPRIKLQRGGKLYAISANRLYDNPGADSILLGGDKIIVEEDRRFFMSLGAAGKEDVFYFTDDRLTALEAISRIGGVADARADPRGILVLREYPASAVSRGTAGPDQPRVVFSIDLTSADGLFSAGKFRIFPGDLVLATESPVTSVRTALSLVGSAFGVVRAATLATE